MPGQTGTRVRAATRIAVSLVCIAALTPASAAGAAGIRLDAAQGTIHYQAADGETNAVTVAHAGNSYTVADAGVTALPDADGAGGCTVSGSTATCPADGVRQLRIAVFDLDDTVTVATSLPQFALVNGGPGNDVLSGGPGVDHLFGREGGDTMTGNDGDDLLDSGPGDVSTEEPTFDDLDGGHGFDTLSYAGRTGPVAVDIGRQFVVDDDGTVDGVIRLEKVVGGLAADEIVGGAGNDVLLGGPGGYDGADTLCGDLGIDTVDYSNKAAPVAVTLDGPLPTDERHAEPQPNVAARIDCRPIGSVPGQPRDCSADDGLAGENDCVGDDVENAVGTAFDDHLTGNDPDPLVGRSSRVEPLGVNTLTGGKGDDRLDGGLGADTFEGGGGFDTVTYERHPADAGPDGPVGVTATIDGSANDGHTGDFNPRTLLSDRIAPDVEALVGSDAADLLEGDANANVLAGGGGDDLLAGEANADTLSGGAGGDVLRGAGGADRLSGADGADTLEGGDGADTLSGEDGDDVLDGGFDPDMLEGGPGADRADYSAATTTVTVSADGIAGDGRAGEGDNVAADVEGITGGSASDVLHGNGAGGLLQGGDGDDLLDGGAGADTFSGGSGRDTLSYASRLAAVTADLSSGSAGEAGEGDTVMQDVENLQGTAAGDVLTGSGDSNVISGGDGNDVLDGGSGADLVDGGGGDDDLSGGGENDTLNAQDGRDSLAGGNGADVLNGGAGDDTLSGGAGPDVLGGDPGLDTVLYTDRTRGVTVDLEGTPDDGEPGENDLVKASIESVRTGAGNDIVDTRDDVAGSVSCGGGADSAVADPQDRVARDCESVGARALAACTSINRAATMTAGRAVRVAIGCSTAASGRLTLETAGKVAAGTKRRRLRLGTASFTSAGARVQRVQVKISRRGARLLTARRKLRVRATIVSRARVATRSLTTRRAFTLRKGPG